MTGHHRIAWLYGATSNRGRSVAGIIPGVEGCPVCGFEYCPDSEADRAEHRRRHRRVKRVFSPSPEPGIVRAHAQHEWIIPVTARSPLCVRKKLYEIAWALNKENGYDFMMWQADGDDGHGYIMADNTGRAIGGCVVRWREYSNGLSFWALQWIWVAPCHRRKGWMRRMWNELAQKHSGLIPEPPFSDTGAAFVRGLPGMPDWIIRAATDVGSNSIEQGPANDAPESPRHQGSGGVVRPIH